MPIQQPLALCKALCCRVIVVWPLSLGGLRLWVIRPTGLFVGASYKLGAVELNANGDVVTKGDNSAFELFFVPAGNNVQVHIENSVFGSNTAQPEVTVSTLTGTGLTSTDQLSFDAQTGLVTFANVA